MNRQTIGRIVSVLVGAGTLFVMEQRFGVSLYIAIPVAIVVYLAVKIALGLLWGPGDKAT